MSKISTRLVAEDTAGKSVIKFHFRTHIWKNLCNVIIGIFNFICLVKMKDEVNFLHKSLHMFAEIEVPTANSDLVYYLWYLDYLVPWYLDFRRPIWGRDPDFPTWNSKLENSFLILIFGSLQ